MDRDESRDPAADAMPRRGPAVYQGRAPRSDITCRRFARGSPSRRAGRRRDDRDVGPFDYHHFVAGKPINVISVESGSGDRASTTARIICPWCGIRTHASAQFYASTRKGDATHSSFVVGCGDCECISLVVAEHHASGGIPPKGDNPAFVYPVARSDYAPSGVPESMARDFREAFECRSAGYLLGAALVGRRVLQAAVRSVVTERSTLYAEIQAVAPDRFTPTLRDAAHQVRLVGNEAAHPDEIAFVDVTVENVDELLGYTGEVLHALFVMPARVAATKARRELAGG
ncbi:MAG: hypothetical protein JWO36_6638 [Myxococcales bacterium]|nr:hypothetical protein [Myxococcales bacterium]